MTKNIGVLATVTETFNIFNDGRKHNVAPQRFLLSSIQAIAQSDKTQERIKLGEAVGFYGHTIREKTNKLKPNEKEWIPIDGKMVEVRVEPAIRCTDFYCDDDGNVTHTEEFLDTDDGKAAYAAYKSGNGGFSWALGGSNGTGKGFVSVARELAGFDYVFNPNFIPTERRDMLLSSVREDAKDMLLSSVVDEGVEKERAESLVNLYARPGYEESTVDEIIMSQLIEKTEALENQASQREVLLSQVVENCPFVLSDVQKNALIHASTPEQAEIVSSIFSSMAQTDLTDLPSDFKAPSHPQAPSVKMSDIPTLGGHKVKFP